MSKILDDYSNFIQPMGVCTSFCYIWSLSLSKLILLYATDPMMFCLSISCSKNRHPILYRKVICWVVFTSVFTLCVTIQDGIDSINCNEIT